MSALSSTIRIASRIGRHRSGCRPRRRCRSRATAAAGGQPAQRLLHVGDRADARDVSCRAAPIRSAGRCDRPVRIATMNVVPRPSSLVTATVPPCRRASSCTSASPMPVPSWVRARACFTRWKRSNMRGSSDCGDADAGVADAELDAIARATRARRESRPSKVNLKALERRFSTIFSHMSRST